MITVYAIAIPASIFRIKSIGKMTSANMSIVIPKRRRLFLNPFIIPIFVLAIANPCRHPLVLPSYIIIAAPASARRHVKIGVEIHIFTHGETQIPFHIGAIILVIANPRKVICLIGIASYTSFIMFTLKNHLAPDMELYLFHHNFIIRVIDYLLGACMIIRLLCTAFGFCTVINHNPIGIKFKALARDIVCTGFPFGIFQRAGSGSVVIMCLVTIQRYPHLSRRHL